MESLLHENCEHCLKHGRRILSGVQHLFVYRVYDSYVTREAAVKLLERINNKTPFHAIVKLNKKSGMYDIGVRNPRRK